MHDAAAPILDYQPPHAHLAGRRANLQRHLLLILAICATVAAIFAEPSLIAHECCGPDPLGILIFAIGVSLPFLAWLGVGIALVVRRVRARRGIDVGPAWPRAIGILFVLTLLLGVRYDTCPHATYITYGTAMVSVGGKPCSNQRHSIPVLFAPFRNR